MNARKEITASILLTMGGLLVFQCLLFSILIVKLAIKIRMSLLFFSIAFLYHVVFAYMLVQRADQFQVEPGGRQLTRVNLANFLTMIRLSSLPTICFMIVLSRQYSIGPILLVYVSIVFLTDLFDGALSRLTHQITKIGKQMDSFSDYLVLMVISIAFIVYQLIPVWFFVGVFVRGFVMIIGMYVLTRARGYLKPETSFIGKASFFAIMFLYAFEIFALFATGWSWTRPATEILEYIVGVILVVSIVDKLLYFNSALKQVLKK